MLADRLPPRVSSLQSHSLLAASHMHVRMLHACIAGRIRLHACTAGDWGAAHLHRRPTRYSDAR